jgi:hypothetical protein
VRTQSGGTLSRLRDGGVARLGNDLCFHSLSNLEMVFD